MTRLLIVEDQFFFRLALRSLIEARDDMQIVAETDRGKSGIELFREHGPDVTIVDLRLPDISGFEVIAELRAEQPRARILVMSNYEGSEDIYRALRAGALAYLTKDAGAEELNKALSAVIAGKQYLSPAVGAALASRMPDTDLTDRERDVLAYLAKGFSNREISQHLKIAENTTRIHVSRILDKLGVEDRTQAVLAAIQRGLVHLT